jgi:hypothetical protein
VHGRRQWPTPKTSRGGYEIDHKTGKKVDTLEGAALKWPGPVVSDTNGPGQHGDGGIDLRMAVSMWKAPKATDGEKGGPNQRGSRGDLALPAMAAQWPGPQARDFKGVNQANPLDHNSRPLNEVAAHFLPPSSPAQPTADGSICSTDIPNTNQPSVKRKLNPIFVEALMRWPTGLSGFERQAMGSILWQQRMLTYLSMLCSRAEPAQPDLFGAAA